MLNRSPHARRWYLAALVAATLAPAALAQGACPYWLTPPGTPERALSAADRKAIFLRVWTDTNENYYDARRLEEVRWAAVRERYVTRVLTAPSDADFYAALNEMVQLLAGPEDNYVLTPQQMDYYFAQAQKLGQIGAFLDGQPGALRVREVMAGLPAEQAGLRAGDLIVAANGNRCAYHGDLLAADGSTLTLTVRAPDGKERQVPVQVAVKWLPPVHATARLGADGSIAFLRLSSLEAPNAWASVDEALARLLTQGTPKGLILDLRGLGSMSIGSVPDILASFVPGNAGSLGGRSGLLPARTSPTPRVYEQLKDTPMVVLVDEETRYGGEDLAAVLQFRKRATVVGARTPGMTLWSDAIPLPGGAHLFLATRDFVLPDGPALAGRGVAPDVPVAGHWWEFTPATDPTVARAIEVLQGK